MPNALGWGAAYGIAEIIDETHELFLRDWP